jgi:predicted transcriptional regulator
MNVLLSIRPEYVEEIVKGNKRYEFRKSVFKKDVDEVWIYATSPMKKIIGTFVTGEIIKDTPENLWKNLNEHSGISEKEFFDYFNGAKVGFAIEIESLKLFRFPVDPKTIFHNFTPPQSFFYFDFSLTNKIVKLCNAYMRNLRIWAKV